MSSSPTRMPIAIAPHETVVWASDMHLGGDDGQAVAERFFAALDQHAPGAAHLFLLGDVFEVWVGDDVLDPYAEALAQRLRDLAQRGTQVWLMRGNRDFMMDVPLPAQPEVPAFSARCAARLLPDPCVITLHGAPTVLTHGDALCTDDHAYQAWRRTCRDPAWLDHMARRPRAERIALGRMARDNSLANHAATPPALMDVNAAAVDALLDEAGAAHVIHGHTHRPGHHTWRVPGHTLLRQRTVLTDWTAARGGCLVCGPDHPAPWATPAC